MSFGPYRAYPQTTTSSGGHEFVHWKPPVEMPLDPKLILPYASFRFKPLKEKLQRSFCHEACPAQNLDKTVKPGLLCCILYIQDKFEYDIHHDENAGRGVNPMLPLYTVTQMREAEQRTETEYGIPPG